MKNSKNCWTVYCHTTPSGKRYIGITSKKPEKRWRNGNGYNNKIQQLFYKAIEKYKWDNIQHNIVSTDLTEKEAKWLENYLICYYWTFVGFNDSKGYNCTLGGEGKVGWKPTKETREKISKSSKGRTSWCKGKHLSEESRRKQSESMKGRTPWNKGKTTPEETRRKNSEAHKGKTPWNKGKNTSGMKGKHHTEESRRKNSEAHKGKKRKPFSEEHKCKIREANKGKHWKLIDGKHVYYE